MREDLTELVCILDRSGSMHSIIDDAIGGVNTFLEDQKKLDGEANFTSVLFDNQIDTLHDNVNLNEVEAFTRDTYCPRGGTSLRDAIGQTIVTVGERLSKTAEEDRPSKVIVAILTDGYENGSREYTDAQIKEMVELQEDKYNWQFIYLAANQDSFETGKILGMKSHNSIDFNATGNGAKTAFANMSLYSQQVRSMEVVDKNSMCGYVALTENDVN